MVLKNLPNLWVVFLSSEWHNSVYIVIIMIITIFTVGYGVACTKSTN